MKTKLILTFLIGFTHCQAPNDQPTDPTPCSPENEGRCECGDVERGFETYTFWIGDVQRCFTVFRPPSRASESLPVSLFSNCYAQDSLDGIDMVEPNSPFNKAAERYGHARIGLSTPDGGWDFGNDGIVNETNPRPCSDQDSQDIPYLKKIFSFIESNSQQFDASKIYANGFSQNSVFTAYIGYCFPDKVIGIWQAGSGLALHGSLPYLPGCEGQVAHTDFVTKCDGCNEECISQNPCPECQYFPIYPCFNPRRPMVECIAEYTNDPISVDQRDPDKFDSGRYMFEKLNDEGHDARFFRFSPNEDIEGGHEPPINEWMWQIGCLGMTTKCSEICEESFIECIEALENEDNVPSFIAFDDCIEPHRFADFPGCTVDCAPTFNMLEAGQSPSTAEFERFGAGSGTPVPRPDSSHCIVN